jgi:dipeptidyl aminopeptidase/acylaminoacyl peptidase
VVDLNAQLPRAAFGPTEVMTYRNRDGVDLWAYLTLPPQSQSRSPKSPLILMPHGGPESRDGTGFDEFAQVLASRGYAVLRPHFRGSSGSGKAFAAAGFRQWGKRMQDDLTDALAAALASGRFDANRVCIVGASYGGYAALAGVAFTPDLYKCAVATSGVSDLQRFLVTERQQETAGKSVGYSYWRR